MSWEYMNLGPGNPGNVMGFCFPQDLSTLNPSSIMSKCKHIDYDFINIQKLKMSAACMHMHTHTHTQKIACK